jgi:hypothetical protein
MTIRFACFFVDDVPFPYKVGVVSPAF